MRLSSLLLVFLISIFTTRATEFNDTIAEVAADTIISIDEVEIKTKFLSNDGKGNWNVTVQGNPLAKGRSLSSFLETIPGVMVIGGGVSIAGREGTIIELDGRTVSYSDLEKIPLYMISRMEVVMTAEGRYGVNATGGVLRVHLRDIPGLLGSISNNMVVNQYGLYEDCPSITNLLRYGKSSFYNQTSVQWDNILTKSERDWHVNGMPSTGAETHIRDHAHQFIMQTDLAYRYDFSSASKFQIYGMLLSNATDETQKYRTGASTLQTDEDGIYRQYSVGSRFDTSFGEEKNGNRNYLILQTNFQHYNHGVDMAYESSVRSKTKEKALPPNSVS